MSSSMCTTSGGVWPISLCGQAAERKRGARGRAAGCPVGVPQRRRRGRAAHDVCRLPGPLQERPRRTGEAVPSLPGPATCPFPGAQGAGQLQATPVFSVCPWCCPRRGCPTAVTDAANKRSSRRNHVGEAAPPGCQAAVNGRARSLLAEVRWSLGVMDCCGDIGQGRLRCS